jgi:hypothetical protein
MSDNIIYMDDLPFNLDASETEVFLKKMPEEISSIGIQWGFNDTVFRDNLFEYVVKEILRFKSVDEYYESDTYKKYSEKGELLSNSMLLGEVKRFKVVFNIVFYDKEMNEAPNHCGSFESVAKDLDVAKKNAFFELAKIVFKTGYVVKKLEIVEILEIKE